MNKYCGICGAEMEEGARFCPRCGGMAAAPVQDSVYTDNIENYSKPVNYAEPAAETTVLDQNAYANKNVGFAPNYNGAPQPAPGFNNPNAYGNAGGNKDNKNSKTKKIIAIILAIALLLSAIGVGLYVFVFRLKKDLKQDYLDALNKITEKKMVAFYYDDYNNDGKSEAFAVVGGEEDSEESFSEADVWFIDDNANKEVAENISGHTNGILQNGDIKYVSIEKESDGRDESVSLVYGVNNVGAYEPEISGRYSGIHQDGDRIVGEDRESGDELIITLNDDGSFSVDEDKESASPAVTAKVKPETTEKATSAATEASTKSTTAKTEKVTHSFEPFDKYVSEFEEKYLVWIALTRPFDSSKMSMAEALRIALPIVPWMGLYSSYYGDYYLKTYYTYGENPDERDPKGRVADSMDEYYANSGKYWWMYTKVSADKVDWLLKNILNYTPNHNFTSEECYYYNGYYYLSAGEGGDGIGDYKMLSKEDLGNNKIRIKYKFGDYSIRTVVAQLKEIDGKPQWTFYSVTEG